jgi:hypothetical protein
MPYLTGSDSGFSGTTEGLPYGGLPDLPKPDLPHPMAANLGSMGYGHGTNSYTTALPTSRPTHEDAWTCPNCGWVNSGLTSDFCPNPDCGYKK